VTVAEGAGLILLLLALGVVALWGFHFPYPSPLIGPLLPPQKRWPVEQLREWVASGKASPGFLAFFLRDPDRTPPPGSNLVSPADGTVLDIIPHQGRQFVVVSLNVWDVHVVRSPIAGTITEVIERGDMFEPTPRDDLRDEKLYFLREKRCPVQKIVRLETAIGRVDVRLVTSYLSRRIEIFPPVGTALGKGERLGRMLFGSTGVLDLPGELRVLVTKGERVVAGETIVCPLDADARAG
jgi:phosphatidylserine decarboxylase